MRSYLGKSYVVKDVSEFMLFKVVRFREDLERRLEESYVWVFCLCRIL